MCLKIIVIFIITAKIINCDQWYRTSIIQEIKPIFQDDTSEHNHNIASDQEQRYYGLKTVRSDNGAKKTIWQSTDRSNESIFVAPTATKLDISNGYSIGDLLLYNSYKNYNQSLSKITSNYFKSNSRNVLNIDNDLEYKNLTKINAPKRRILRKCPTSRSERIKQSSDNSRIKSRFLEVFEVVEFEHVVCTSISGLEGRCLHEYDCQTAGGAPMGTCADGYGICCVITFSCYGQSSAAVSWFTNPQFPSPSTDRLACALILNKTSDDIKQIRLDLAKFELLPPTSGTCEQDQFVVSGQNTNHVIPILCGINTGQHLYIEVDGTEGPICLTIQTVAAKTRLFAIKVTQIMITDILAAPTGCLQYFNEPQGYIESFNYRNITDIENITYPSFMNNLNYAICINREKSSCSVTYTNEDHMQIVNYDTDGLPLIPPRQAGVEIFNCPSDWLLIAAVRLCGERLNDGSVIQDFYLDAPVTDINAGPIVIWFRSDEGYVGRGFKLHYQQNSCTMST